MEVPHRKVKLKEINNFDEQLFLLLTFLHHGSTTLTLILSSPFYETQNAIVRLLHSIVSHFRAPLADLFLIFYPEVLEESKDVRIVVDCSVIPTNRPGGKLEYCKKYYTGICHICNVKVEVGVNHKVGTASTISSIFTGLTNDFTIFNEHYTTFEHRLGGTKILADSAFIGAKPELEAIITKPVGTPELATHRVIVERFFGRLKTLFIIFHHSWIYKMECVAVYFSVACCLTDFYILHNPLTKKDAETNSLFLEELYASHMRKIEARKITNERYLSKMKN